MSRPDDPVGNGAGDGWWDDPRLGPPPEPEPDPARGRLSRVWVAVAALGVVFVGLLVATVVVLGGDGDDVEAADGSPDGEATAPADPSSPPVTGAEDGPADGDVVLAADAPATSFRSPTGNIGCLIGPDGVTCELAQADWTLPRPDGCEGAWGGEGETRVVAVGLDAEAAPVCEPDAVRDPEAQTVPYGQAVWLADQLVCRSAETGMRCESLVSGRGFAVSRADLELF